MNIKIEKLYISPFSTQLAFAYLFCERVYPDYVYFVNTFSFGDEKIARKAIDDIRSCLVNNILVSTEQIQQNFDYLYANTPDMGDFNTVYASNALDACSVILNSLQFLLDKKFDHIIYISRYGIDKADRSILESNKIEIITPEVEAFILNHSTMINEIEMQNEIITHLVSNSAFDVDHLIAQFK